MLETINLFNFFFFKIIFSNILTMQYLKIRRQWCLAIELLLEFPFLPKYGFCFILIKVSASICFILLMIDFPQRHHNWSLVETGYMQGETGKMSASDPNSAIYVTDSEKDIKNKVSLWKFQLAGLNMTITSIYGHTMMDNECSREFIYAQYPCSGHHDFILMLTHGVLDKLLMQISLF